MTPELLKYRINPCVGKWSFRSRVWELPRKAQQEKRKKIQTLHKFAKVMWQILANGEKIKQCFIAETNEKTKKYINVPHMGAQTTSDSPLLKSFTDTHVQN